MFQNLSCEPDQEDLDKYNFTESVYCRDFEYQAGLPSVGVEGRLYNCRSFWLSTLSAPLFVQNIVTFGYALPLKAFPESAFFNNNCSALRHPSFVEEAIPDLLNKCCIKEHDFPLHVVNPLTVAEGKKLRLVLDLRYVNSLIKCPRFKYEDLRTLSEIFESGFFSLRLTWKVGMIM